MQNTKILRNYQKDCIQSIENHFLSEKKQLIQLPTGAGKTVVLWHYLKANEKNGLIIVPSVQLGEQIFLEGLNYFSNNAISCKFGKYNQKIKNFHITTIQSLKNKYVAKEIYDNKFGLIAIDEAHRAGAKSYLKFIKETNWNPKILGLTATPERNDQISLESIFEKITYKIDLIDLILEGHLCDINATRIKTNIDIKKIKLDGNGDFTISSLYKCLGSEQRNDFIFNIFHEKCKDLKTLIFAINIEHCLNLEKLFLEKGIKAKAIFGKQSLNHRLEILKNFRNGNIQVLINAQLLTEGFDEPSIQSIIIARPTLSRVLYTQMVGRGLRNHESKNECFLYELADNYHRICNFLSLSYDYDFQSLNVEYPDNLRFSNLHKNKKEMELELLGYEEEKINLFNDESDFLNCKAYEWLEKEVKLNFLTNKEALFVAFIENLKRICK